MNKKRPTKMPRSTPSSASHTGQQVKKTKGDLIFTSSTALTSWAFVGIFLVIPVIAVLFYNLFTADPPTRVETLPGYYSVSKSSLESDPPISLTGTWFLYEDIYYDSDILPPEFSSETFVPTSLPISDFSKSRQTASYRALVSYPLLDSTENPVVLGINFLKEDVSVYLNGFKLEPFTPLSTSMLDISISTFFNLSDHYNSQNSYQELVICSNNDQGDTDLFDRNITISSYANGLYEEKMLTLIEGLFAGMAYCVMMTGFIYMIIRPQRSTLTLVNLFDIVLIVYVIYAHTSISPFLGQIIQYLSLSDTAIQGMVLFFFCMVIALGNDLIENIFLCEKKIHFLFNHPLNCVFFALAVIFMINPFLSAGFLYYVLIFFGMVVVLCIFWRIWAFCKCQKMTPYLLFQAWKSLFIICVLTVDVLLWHIPNNATSFFLAQYCLFFIIHLFVRAYEYALPEKKIAEINRNLEATIAERTEKLTQANQVLQELSIRDALTKSYNRMYFERILLEALQRFHHHQAEEPLKIYLCIFDLDNFKQINDQFGHNAGDEQLLETIEIAQSIMPEDVVISRIGGEEFTFLFEEYEQEEVISWVEKMRCGLEQYALEKEGRTTGSFGITQATVFSDRKTFFIHADECLYHSKQNGKNCITHDFEGEKEIAPKTS